MNALLLALSLILTPGAASAVQVSRPVARTAAPLVRAASIPAPVRLRQAFLGPFFGQLRFLVPGQKTTAPAAAAARPDLAPAAPDSFSFDAVPSAQGAVLQRHAKTIASAGLIAQALQGPARYVAAPKGGAFGPRAPQGPALQKSSPRAQISKTDAPPKLPQKKPEAPQPEKDPLLVRAYGVAAAAAVAVASLCALTMVDFLPLPAELAFAHSQIAQPQAFLTAALSWGAISLGASLSTVIANERFDRKAGPTGKKGEEQIPMAVFVLSLPFMAAVEEGMFRWGLMGGAAWLLTAFSMPVVPAIVAASVLSSAVFARAHNYGPMLPRFMAGLMLCYVALTQGLLTAIAAHFFMNVAMLLHAGAGYLLWLLSRKLSSR